jgi:hypothetical protein
VRSDLGVVLDGVTNSVTELLKQRSLDDLLDSLHALDDSFDSFDLLGGDPRFRPEARQSLSKRTVDIFQGNL